MQWAGNRFARKMPVTAFRALGKAQRGGGKQRDTACKNRKLSTYYHLMPPKLAADAYEFKRYAAPMLTKSL
jgi:hypothetical protein